jgi:hypothetical protein
MKNSLGFACGINSLGFACGTSDELFFFLRDSRVSPAAQQRWSKFKVL